MGESRLTARKRKFCAGVPLVGRFEQQQPSRNTMALGLWPPEITRGQKRTMGAKAGPGATSVATSGSFTFLAWTPAISLTAPYTAPFAPRHPLSKPHRGRHTHRLCPCRYERNQMRCALVREACNSAYLFGKKACQCCDIVLGQLCQAKPSTCQRTGGLLV